MKIEALENIKSHNLVLTSGDIVTVPDDVGAELCARGWARDIDGTIATGERIVLDARIVVDTAVHAQAATEVGNG